MSLYRSARMVAIQRDGGRCLICRGAGPLTTHHLIPRHLTRDDRAANLVALCQPCHNLIEQLDALPSLLAWLPHIIRRDMRR